MKLGHGRAGAEAQKPGGVYPDLLDVIGLERNHTIGWREQPAVGVSRGEDVPAGAPHRDGTLPHKKAAADCAAGVDCAAHVELRRGRRGAYADVPTAGIQRQGSGSRRRAVSLQRSEVVRRVVTGKESFVGVSVPADAQLLRRIISVVALQGE